MANLKNLIEAFNQTLNLLEKKKIKAICINDKNWFGTKGKRYEILHIKKKELKDIRFKGDNLEYLAYQVIDDYGQKVDIPENKFILD